MSSDWWAKKLAPVVQQPHGLVVQPAQPQPVQYHQPPQPQAQPVPIGVPIQPGERQQVLDPNRDRNAEIPFGEAMRLWRGGEAHRQEGGMSCPNCGSTTGFTRYSGMNAAGARVNGQQPRAHCFECGYRGDGFMQADQSRWGS